MFFIGSFSFWKIQKIQEEKKKEAEAEEKGRKAGYKKARKEHNKKIADGICPDCEGKLREFTPSIDDPYGHSEGLRRGGGWPSPIVICKVCNHQHRPH